MIISRLKPVTITNQYNGNTCSRTVFRRSNGIYGHFPKYWKCQSHYYTYESCVPGTRHLSYVGYLAIITPWGHGNFWYMGGSPRKKILEWHGIKKSN